MATESYTRITANRIFGSLNMKIGFDTIDKILTRSQGFCHQLISSLSAFTRYRNQADRIGNILGLNQDIIVELIFKLQASMVNATPEGSEQEKEIHSLREYSEKLFQALEDIKEKITIQEVKFTQLSKEALQQWQKKQRNNAEILTDALIASGEKMNEAATQKLAQLLFLEICNEKSFDSEKQIFFSIEQVLGSADVSIASKVKQVIIDAEKTKKQLIQSVEGIPQATANEQAILTELHNRARALSSATHKYISQEEISNDNFKLLAGELQDIASEEASHTAPAA